MNYIHIAFALYFAVSTVHAGINPGLDVCPGGPSGGICSRSSPCPGGYTCINSVCCTVRRCRSGVWGPACSSYNPCKPGYICIGDRCCRDWRCPPGDAVGPSCSLNDPKSRGSCPAGYECRDNEFCCRPASPIGRCPPVIPSRAPCAMVGQPLFQCSSTSDCSGNQLCCRHECGFMMCTDPRQPRRG